jgi:N-acetylmuramoyl-L-alanine amidase
VSNHAAYDSHPANGLPTVIIDPGHGGVDEGTKYYGLAEKEISLDVALRLERILSGYHFPVLLTRRDDHYVPLAERVATANQVDQSLFISIHFNQSTVGNVTGVETFYADQKLPPPDDWTWIGIFSRVEQEPLDNGETLAGYIQTTMTRRLGAMDRGMKSRSLYVIRHTRMPAVLVECGFISNPMENQLLKNVDYRERIANALAEGIMTYEATQFPAIPVQKLASAFPSPTPKN